LAGWAGIDRRFCSALCQTFPTPTSFSALSCHTRPFLHVVLCLIQLAASAARQGDLDLFDKNEF
jgi:hypothetical protein